MRIRSLGKEDWLLIKRALRYIQPHKLKFSTAFLFILSGIGFGIIEPLLWGKILVDLFNKDMNNALTNILFIVLLNIVNMLIEFGKRYLFAYMSENIIFSLKRDMYQRVLQLPVKAFDELKSGEFISRINSDAASLANVLTNQILNNAVDVLRVIIIGITVFTISVPLALIVIASFPFSYFIFHKSGKVLRKKGRDIARLNDKYISTISENIWGIREIISLGIKKKSLETFQAQTLEIKNKFINISVIDGLSQILSQGVNFLSRIGVIIVGGFLIVSGLLAMDLFIAFTSYSNQFSGSLMNLTRLNSEIQKTMTSLERIFHLMDNLSYQKIIFGDRYIENIKGSICFKNVSFAYDPYSPVLSNLSLKIEADSKTAIVGSSGSGKTTLFNLLLRFYQLNSGKILIDDIDINEFDEESLRDHISIVRQEPFLFEASIRDNLLLANPHATQRLLEEACGAAYIHDFIAGLPQKYDSMIGENGINLSGGQKQRLAIARALLKNSRIILFDEATSSLDNESQHLIKKAMDSISPGRTVVIIAHRLSTIAEVDNIIVVDKGKVAGQGNHSDLIRKNSVYKRLYERELNIAKDQSKGVAVYS